MSVCLENLNGGRLIFLSENMGFSMKKVLSDFRERVLYTFINCQHMELFMKSSLNIVFKFIIFVLIIIEQATHPGDYLMLKAQNSTS